MPKGKRSVMKLAKAAEGRNMSARHQRRAIEADLNKAARKEARHDTTKA